MYSDNRLQQINEDTFTFAIRKDEDFRILQLTDLHLGFGWLSRSKDTLAMDAVRQLIERSKPDMLVLTGVMTVWSGIDYVVSLGKYIDPEK